MSGSLDTEIADLTKKVANLTTVDASATELIKGFSQKLQDAVAAAKSAGVQDAQLQSLTDLGSAIDNATSGLAAAVAQGTTSTDAPAAPAPAPAPAPAATDPAAPAAADPAAAAPAPTAP